MKDKTTGGLDERPRRDEISERSPQDGLSKQSESVALGRGSLLHYFLSLCLSAVPLLPLALVPSYLLPPNPRFLFTRYLARESFDLGCFTPFNTITSRCEATLLSKSSTSQSLQQHPPQCGATRRPRIHFGYGAIPRVVGNLRKLAAFHDASRARQSRTAT